MTISHLPRPLLGLVWLAAAVAACQAARPRQQMAAPGAASEFVCAAGARAEACATGIGIRWRPVATRPRPMQPPRGASGLAGYPGGQTGSLRPAATLELDAYIAELDRCSHELPQVVGNSSAISSFRQSVPREWIVQAGPERFRVSNDWLDVALARLERPGVLAGQSLHDALGRLAFLRAQAIELKGAGPALSTASARAQLDAILQRREFRGLQPPGPLAIWLHKLLARIAGLIERLYARLHLGALSGNILAYALLAVALALLGFWWWRGLARRAAPLEVPGAAGIAQQDSRQWTDQALEAANRCDYREAIRCGYWAGVGRLADAGALPRDPSLTPRERLRALAVQQEAAPLVSLTSRFELVWYGYRPPSAGDWQSTQAELEKMGCFDLSTPAIARS